MDLWNTATYKIKPLFLQIPGMAKVEIEGGHVPEYHVIVDPLKLQAAHLALQDVRDALTKNNLVAAAGMIAENYRLYLTTVDGRVHSADGHRERGDYSQRWPSGADQGRGAELSAGRNRPITVVTAQGRQAVLFNIESQPDANVLQIASTLKAQLKQLHRELPPDMHLAFFYDQSQFVRDSVGSVWDAIIFGLILSVFILYFFLKNWGSVWTAIVTIPISVLITFVVMRLMGMSFNMMTLGGIAASIGLIIDNAIVVVEAMCHRHGGGRAATGGHSRGDGRNSDRAHRFDPDAGGGVSAAGLFERNGGRVLSRVGSDDGGRAARVTGPGGHSDALARRLVHSRTRESSEHGQAPPGEEGGFLLKRMLWLYESAVRWALRHAWLTLLACALILVAGVFHLPATGDGLSAEI